MICIKFILFVIYKRLIHMGKYIFAFINIIFHYRGTLVRFTQYFARSIKMTIEYKESQVLHSKPKRSDFEAVDDVSQELKIKR